MEIQLIVNGQSNEAGTNTRWRTAHGVAINTSADGGPAGSFTQRLAELITIRDKHLVTPVYAAQGSKSIAVNMMGLCRGPWVSGFQPTKSIFTSDGGLWRLDSGTTTLTTAPTGTADTTTAEGTVWKYLGVINPALDFLGHVYKYGERGFDPETRLAGTTLATIPAGMSTYDRRIAFISFGQQDAPNSAVTRQVYRDAHIAMTEMYLALGVEYVGIGFTCYAASLDTQYGLKLIPGVEDALAYFAGDKRVFRGFNARTGLGVLPATPTAGIVGLQDTLHANPEACRPWGEGWYQAMKTAGVI